MAIGKQGLRSISLTSPASWQRSMTCFSWDALTFALVDLRRDESIMHGCSAELVGNAAQLARTLHSAVLAVKHTGPY